jgi:C4-dicarboxylate transporter, DctM subunit
VATATLFAWLMSYYNAFDPVAEFFIRYSTNSEVFLLYVIGIFVILGTFMDPVPAMIIVVPILVPIAEELGIHGLLLGILVVMALCVGKITPPYGISLLISCAIAEISISKAMKPTFILFVVFCLVMVIVVFAPELALVIPRAVMPGLFS